MFNPSPYQERIFDWFRNPTGPIAINAKAGSGKTTTIVKGIGQMSGNGSKLFAAFNNAIVKELESRLPKTVKCQTLHSLGYATLRKGFPASVKWDPKNGNVKYRAMVNDLRIPASSLPAGVEADMVRDCILKLVAMAQLTLTPIEVESLVEMADRFGIEIPFGVDRESIAATVKSLIEAGIDQLKHGLVSFSDMLYAPMFLGLTPDKYKLIAVDEAQDLSKVQMALLTRALDTGGNFIAVGDPRQAIYMFAGAESDSFYQLRDHFSAQELPLNFCYRCPERVIQEAQKIVPDIECPEGTRAGVVETITSEQMTTMVKRGDMILCRLTAPLVAQCFRFIKQGIPARVRGRDIGGQIANNVKQIMKRNTDISQFPGLMYDWLGAQLSVLRSKLGTEDQQQSLQDRVDCLEICYAMFRPTSVEQFQYKIKELFSDDQSPITLCTIHRAKGLENPRVFIIRPDKLPLVRKGQTADQVTQELNLKYVAVTRAQEELYFVMPDPKDDAESSPLNPGLPGI